MRGCPQKILGCQLKGPALLSRRPSGKSPRLQLLPWPWVGKYYQPFPNPSQARFLTSSFSSLHPSLTSLLNDVPGDWCLPFAHQCHPPYSRENAAFRKGRARCSPTLAVPETSQLQSFKNVFWGGSLAGTGQLLISANVRLGGWAATRAPPRLPGQWPGAGFCVPKELFSGSSFTSCLVRHFRKNKCGQV